MPNFCSQCGYKNQDDAQFCAECGRPLRKPALSAAGVTPAGSLSPTMSSDNGGMFTPGGLPIKALIIGVVVVALLAGGAGLVIFLLGPESASEAALTKAVQKFVDETPAYSDQRTCLSNFAYERDPVAINAYDERAKRWMAVLVEGGVYDGPEQRGFGGFPPQAQLVYKKTVAGTKATKGRRLCFAEGLTVSKVENILSPEKIGDGSIVRADVTFSYRNPAPWSQSPATREMAGELRREPKQLFSFTLNQEGKWAVSTGLGQAQAQRRQTVQQTDSPAPAGDGFFDKFKNFFSGFGGGGSSISGEYGGEECPYKLTFKGKDTVYVQILGMMEVPGQYKVDGDKVSVTAPNWPGAVFTRKGNTLEALFMGQKMVCRPTAEITKKQERPSTQIAALQTLDTEEGKEMVLSVTLSDGNNVKYLVKLPKADTLEATAKEAVSKEKVSSWELERLGTALSIGNNPLPHGVALKFSN